MASQDLSARPGPKHRCCCTAATHATQLVVLTGGPGGGKTAVLELARRFFCEHVVILPEAASIVYGGGFPRNQGTAARRASQRAIYHVQRELEAMALEEGHAAIVVCDRGTIDGLAYWPAPPETLWSELGTSLAAELARYSAVIHLRTPSAGDGYDHQNPLRIESAQEAARIDHHIMEAWKDHPRRRFVGSDHEFMIKAAHALDLIAAEIPRCCAPTP